MKLNLAFVSVVALGALFAMPTAFAAPKAKLVKACKRELKKFACEAKTDAEVHECLEKNEKKGEKNEGFTPVCYKAHEAYEKTAGKEEKEEKKEEKKDEKKD